jgi:hypothetical protein
MVDYVVREERDMDLHSLTTEQILEEMAKCEDIADSLQEELIARAKGVPLQETELHHLTIEELLTKAEDCQQAWIVLQEVIISRAKERDLLVTHLERIRTLVTSLPYL